MTTSPRWHIALAVYLVYNTIIFATWASVGARYTDLVSEQVALTRLVLPLGLGAVFLAVAVSALGWWRPATREAASAGPRWALWIVVVAMLAFVGACASGTNWGVLSPHHLALLAVGGVLVGFNEELLNRGVLFAGARGSGWNERQVWLFSALLFGAMHIPNALFGMPWYAGLIQAVFAATMGCGFYVVRRVSGSVFLPMLLHGAWDFSSFSQQASHGSSPGVTVVQFGTYLIAIVAVVAVLRDAHRAPSEPDPRGETQPAVGA